MQKRPVIKISHKSTDRQAGKIHGIALLQYRVTHM